MTKRFRPWKVMLIVLASLAVLLGGGYALVVGTAYMISDPASKGAMVLGVRADNGDLTIALGATCPANVTYTVMFDRDNLTVNSQSKTMVFTDSQPLAVFDPFHLPPRTTVLTPFPTGFQWQEAQVIDIFVVYADGTEGNNTRASLSDTAGSSDHPPDTYNFSPEWLTIDQALDKPDWVTACSPQS